MKYYSETLKKVFDTEAELVTAEKENEKKLALIEAERAEKKEAAKKVEDAFKEANEAYKKANAELKAFCEKYGSYHQTITDCNLPTTTLFDSLFDNWFWKF